VAVAVAVAVEPAILQVVAAAAPAPAAVTRVRGGICLSHEAPGGANFISACHILRIRGLGRLFAAGVGNV